MSTGVEVVGITESEIILSVYTEESFAFRIVKAAHKLGKQNKDIIGVVYKENAIEYGFAKHVEIFWRKPE